MSIPVENQLGLIVDHLQGTDRTTAMNELKLYLDSRKIPEFFDLATKLGVPKKKEKSEEEKQLAKKKKEEAAAKIEKEKEEERDRTALARAQRKSERKAEAIDIFFSDWKPEMIMLHKSKKILPKPFLEKTIVPAFGAPKTYQEGLQNIEKAMEHVAASEQNNLFNMLKVSEQISMTAELIDNYNAICTPSEKVPKMEALLKSTSAIGYNISHIYNLIRVYNWIRRFPNLLFLPKISMHKLLEVVPHILDKLKAEDDKTGMWSQPLFNTIPISATQSITLVAPDISFKNKFDTTKIKEELDNVIPETETMKGIYRPYVYTVSDSAMAIGKLFLLFI